MARILARPHERLAEEPVDRPIWAADRINGASLSELAARAVDRIRVPPDSPLGGSPITLRLAGVLPARIRVGRSIPTTDTLENRFVAAVLDRCLAIVRAVSAHAARDSGPAMEPVDRSGRALCESGPHRRVLRDRNGRRLDSLAGCNTA